MNGLRRTGLGLASYLLALFLLAQWWLAGTVQAAGPYAQSQFPTAQALPLSSQPATLAEMQRAFPNATFVQLTPDELEALLSAVPSPRNRHKGRQALPAAHVPRARDPGERAPSDTADAVG